MKNNKDSVKGLKCLANKYKSDIKYTYKISDSYNTNKDSQCLNVYSIDEISKYMIDEDVLLYNDIKKDIDRSDFNKRSRYCDTCFRSLTISPTGDVIICTALRMNCGNILKERMDNIWFNSNVINKWRNEYSIINKKCLSCKNINYCEPCPAGYYNKYNKIDGIDNNSCKFGKILSESIKITNKTKT